MITLEQAKSLKYRQVIYHTMLRNADGSPRRYRVNGKVKTWKRQPHRVDVPLKWGLYAFDRLNETNLYQFSMTEAEAKQDVKLDADTLFGPGFSKLVAAIDYEQMEVKLNAAVRADPLDSVQFANEDHHAA